MTKVSNEQDVKHKEQECAELKQSVGELTSERDSLNTELPAVPNLLNVMNVEDKFRLARLRRRARLREALQRQGLRGALATAS